MRSGGGTKAELDGSVVARTNARIASFARPAFQDGRGSAWARAGLARASPDAVAARAAVICRRDSFISTSGKPGRNSLQGVLMARLSGRSARDGAVADLVGNGGGVVSG